MDQEIEKLHTVSQDIREKFLKPPKIKKKSWMTNEILDMMEERRKSKDQDMSLYKRIDKDIKKAIRIAKDTRLREQCAEIQQLQHKHDSFNMHKKVKEAAGLYKPRRVGCLADNQGKPLLSVEEKLDTWKKHVEYAQKS
uniref:Uncharacterized protein LOC114337589 n=1 Tax=Diabrotica virgifera virgifera TaxID=50390 RepID=A0A6P7GAQ2_DIAVI